jgi:hypothetical protein
MQSWIMQRVRVWPRHWERGESCICWVIEVDGKYANLQDTGRPSNIFMYPISEISPVDTPKDMLGTIVRAVLLKDED